LDSLEAGRPAALFSILLFSNPETIVLRRSDFLRLHDYTLHHALSDLIDAILGFKTLLAEEGHEVASLISNAASQRENETESCSVMEEEDFASSC
jgi:hypothetical protein